MSRKKKKTKKQVRKNKISHKRLAELLSRYGRIKVIFTRDYKTREVSQERIITADGGCVVRYAEKRYVTNPDGSYRQNPNGTYVISDKIRWSRYRTSCFRGDIEYAMKFVKSKKARTQMIIEALRQHDLRYIFTNEVYVGKGYKRKVA